MYSQLLDEISFALQKKEDEYPIKGDAHQYLIEVIRNFSNHLLAVTSFDSFIPDSMVLQELGRFASNPVFICGSMKSGTTLLAQLLDGHPELFVLPGDTHFVNFTHRWKREQFAEISRHWIQRVVIPTFKEPYWFLGPDRSDLELFLQYLRYFLFNSEYEIPMCVVLAIGAANHNRTNLSTIRYWVEKTPKNEFHVQALVEKFPRAKFIHIVRDPLENIASLKKLAQFRNWEYDSVSFAYALRDSFRAARRNSSRLSKDAYLVLKYENLVANHQATLEEIANFLSIPFHQALLTPTENGRPASSNSMFADRRVTGQIIDQSQDIRFRSILDENEIKEIVTILFSEATIQGYNWFREEIIKYRGHWLYQQSTQLKRIYGRSIRMYNQRKR